MSFAPNQILQTDLIQLLLANQAANVNLWNPANILLGANPLLAACLPIPTPTPQPFQFAQPFLPTPSVIPTPLPATPLPSQPRVKAEVLPVKEEPSEPKPCEPVTDPFEMGSIPTSTYYPTHFMRGTQLKIANGDIKKVEDLSSDDFLKCAVETNDVIVNASVVTSIIMNSAASVTIVFETGLERQQIPLKCQIEHPFFVLGKGWSSCNPRKSGENYGLECDTLQIDDVCIVLTKKEDERTGCAVDIVTAERDLELFSRRAALREQLVEVYYEHLSGRNSAPPERIVTHPPTSHRQRRTSE